MSEQTKAAEDFKRDIQKSMDELTKKLDDLVEQGDKNIQPTPTPEEITK